MMKNIRGFNLVELMIAITIGLIILLTMLAVVNNTSKSFRVNDDNARLLDIGSLAMRQLTSDLSQAGFFGEQNSQSPTLKLTQTLANTVPILAEDTDNDNLTRAVMQLNPPGIQQPFRLSGPASPYTLNAGMPVINIRTSTRLIQPGNPDLLNDNGIYLEADLGGGVLFRGTDYSNVVSAGEIRDRISRGVLKETNIYEYQSYTYYIGNDPSDVQNRNPMLIRRMINRADGGYVDQPIAEGVEALSIQWGVGADGVATQLIADTDAALMPTVTANWGRVVSATIFLLVRVPAPGYTDPPGTTYTLGGGEQGNGRVFNGVDSGFRRRIFTVTIQLRNRSKL